ncbi:hypothetical protein [Streptomyces sp. CC228A]|uniref:hypothetical protein n=1 Tax=Streptomyces sp. CC228A TaxID=2898186 RepID=UPI001F361268|nr:hypothetical protein [Streptomyces sp. CC228A]
MILAAMKTRQTAAGIAASLEAACMLQSPETAAEMRRLRERVAELEARVGDGSTRCVDEDPVVYTLTDAAVEMLAERSPSAAERHAPGACQCRTDRDGDGRGWIKYRGRDGEFVGLRCRDHGEPGVGS